MRFAVITDPHINPSAEHYNSPFAVNKLANKRYDQALELLNQLKLDFVLNLGDMVHPVPTAVASYEQAAKQYRKLSEKLIHPLYHIPGNHDVGDKALAWTPAEPINKASLSLYRKCFGKDYYLIEKHCCILALNAQLFNSGLMAEAQQQRWLETTLASLKGKRIFVALHYPPYLHSADEDEHYDNIAPSIRSKLIALFSKYKVELLLSGHVHNFWYQKINHIHHYSLPALSFVRQDYSEIATSPPSTRQEGGRNDSSKLGFIIVNVSKHGHWIQQIRLLANKPTQVAHPKVSRVKNPGIDMRDDWLQSWRVPPSGALDEFDRKVVRNDYPLLCLWEMGISQLRIPMDDLYNHQQRLKILNEQGHRFSVYSFGLPNHKQLQAISDNLGFIENWEIAITIEDYPELLKQLLQLNFESKVYLSLIHPRKHSTNSQVYYHTIKHRFRAEDSDLIQQIASQDKQKLVKGLVFYLDFEQPLFEQAQQIARLAEANRYQANIYVHLKGQNPAAWQRDASLLVSKVTEAFFANQLANVQLYLDTLADVDRGYFRRSGLVDRQYNPHPAFYQLCKLNEEFDDSSQISNITLGETDRTLRFDYKGKKHTIHLTR